MPGSRPTFLTVRNLGRTTTSKAPPNNRCYPVRNCAAGRGPAQKHRGRRKRHAYFEMPPTILRRAAKRSRRHFKSDGRPATIEQQKCTPLVTNEWVRAAEASYGRELTWPTVCDYQARSFQMLGPVAFIEQLRIFVREIVIM